MNPTAYIRERDGAVFISVKAQPRAKRTEIVGLVGDQLSVRVSAPPVDSAANEALREAIAEWLGRPRSSVTLERGGAARRKVFRVSGVTAAEAHQRLLPSGGK
jgi:uncharacterized protein